MLIHSTLYQLTARQTLLIILYDYKGLDSLNTKVARYNFHNHLIARMEEKSHSVNNIRSDIINLAAAENNRKESHFASNKNFNLHLNVVLKSPKFKVRMPIYISSRA